MSSRVDPRTGERLKNFWGYDPLGFFAPKASYASVRQDGAQVLEFKEMVRAFHREGLEVILDVVFNHTVRRRRAGTDGVASAASTTRSTTGWTTTSASTATSPARARRSTRAHPVVRDLILDALRYWVMEMHVDGFRFDLASVLGRDVHGRVLADAPSAGAHRRGSDPPRRQAHRRGLGRRGRLSGGRVLPAPVGGMEWSLPRRRAAVLARGRGHDGRASPAGSAAAPICTPDPARGRSAASTSSRATTASR